MLPTDFTALPLRAELTANLSSLGYHAMTDIQAQSLPPLLQGRDVLAQAKTGSGKTAAFGLWLLNKLDTSSYHVQALVLCPTRELADQVAEELRRLARAIANVKILSVCGGKPFGPQAKALANGSHIIVGTPGRVDDHLRKGTLSLQKLQSFALDEADRMLDMGFQSQLDAIAAHLSGQQQTALFSATLPEATIAIAKKMLQSPERIQLQETHTQASITQRFYCVDDAQHRLLALRLLLLAHLTQAAVVFCNTKQDVNTVLQQIQVWGFDALALHGDLDQKTRDHTLIRFAHGSANVLVATDVAARGIDIDAVDLIINYQLSRQRDTHTHRIGRTGRAGSSGMACSLYSDNERYKLEQLMADGLVIEPCELPSKDVLAQAPRHAPMVSLQLNGGKKQKLRAGDIVGALTAQGGIEAAAIGKISVQATWSYVAVNAEHQHAAITHLSQRKLKGRSFKVRVLA